MLLKVTRMAEYEWDRKLEWNLIVLEQMLLIIDFYPMWVWVLLSYAHV